MPLIQLKKIAKKTIIPLNGALFYYNLAKKVLPQKALKDFPILKIEKTKILFIAPHPDDESLGGFQLLHQAMKNKSDIKLILLTDGNKRGLKKIRKKEFNQVIQKIGIDISNLIYLNHKDGNLPKIKETLEHELKQIISDYSPNYIVSPHPKDIHKDHRIVAKILLKIWTQNKKSHNPFILLQYLIHYPPFYPWPRKFSPKKSLMPPTSLITPSQKGTWKIIKLKPQEVEKKKEVIDIYKSQLKNPILKGLMYSLIRKNELFMSYDPNNAET